MHTGIRVCVDAIGIQALSFGDKWLPDTSVYWLKVRHIV